ncbi:MAG TPA: response regulator [Candidatus Nanopelagicales bacterium]|nr:response regulator [Candidatus Nanopelagicales bacterium]
MTTQAPNILLLDQDDILRRATELLLSHRGAGVSAAATLDEAIAFAQQRPYDVALIDINPAMPGALDLLARLRSEGLAARVVLCSDSPLSSEQAGEDAEVLVKPYPFDRLVTAVFGSRPRREKPRATVGGARRANRSPRPAPVGLRRTARTGALTSTRSAPQRPAERVLRSPPRVGRGRRHPG